MSPGHGAGRITRRVSWMCWWRADCCCPMRDMYAVRMIDLCRHRTSVLPSHRSSSDVVVVVQRSSPATQSPSRRRHPPLTSTAHELLPTAVLMHTLPHHLPLLPPVIESLTTNYSLYSRLVCMYVCMYICMYIICMDGWIHTDIHMHACMYVCVYVTNEWSTT